MRAGAAATLFRLCRRGCYFVEAPPVSRRQIQKTGRQTMTSLVVMYKVPTDIAAFDKHYTETHIPLAKKLPGLRKYTISQGAVVTPAGPSPYHLVATLDFDDLGAIQKAFGSPEGQAAVADVQVMATGGTDMIMFDSRVV
jgi:uncharacterized protein (TIGR02118 family)